MGLIPPYIFVIIAFGVFVQTKYLVQFRLRESMFGAAKLKVAWTVRRHPTSARRRQALHPPRVVAPPALCPPHPCPVCLAMGL